MKKQIGSMRCGVRGRVIVALIVAGVATTCVAATSLVVETQYGRVRGTTGPSGVTTFHGIPFAAPPEGDRRWKPPEPPEPWTVPRDGFDRAQRQRAMCPQLDLVHGFHLGSENCPWAGLRRDTPTQPRLVALRCFSDTMHISLQACTSQCMYLPVAVVGDRVR